MSYFSSIEPVFKLGGSNDLYFEAQDWSTKASRYLAHAVARKPDDLHAHVQRISHLSLHGAESEIYGALVDLFISLGAKGRELRKQMLRINKGNLNLENHSFLQKKLEHYLVKTDVIPGDAVSVLSSNYTGTGNILKYPELETEAERSPIGLAESYVEYGELHSARALLEIELLQGRSNAEQEKLLLEVYSMLDDPDLFHKVGVLVNRSKLHHKAKWESLENHFKQKSS